jgi:hypothetical protein
MLMAGGGSGETGNTGENIDDVGVRCAKENCGGFGFGMGLLRGLRPRMGEGR